MSEGYTYLVSNPSRFVEFVDLLFECVETRRVGLPLVDLLTCVLESSVRELLRLVHGKIWVLPKQIRD